MDYCYKIKVLPIKTKDQKKTYKWSNLVQIRKLSQKKTY